MYKLQGMVISQFISSRFVPLYPHQQVAEALASMHNQHVQELPVVAEDHFTYLGIATEAQLNDFPPTLRIGEIPMGEHKPAIFAQANLFDALRVYQQNQLSVIPVLDEAEHYVGTVTVDKLLEGLAKMMNVQEPGAIIQLQMAAHDYMLSDVARLAELNDVRLLDVCTQYDSTHDIVNVYLKTNRMDVQALVATYTRYHYQVVQVYAQESSIDSLRDNYDMLMNYINM
ncbi:CBS domain-containing protein [Thermoflavifilum aggregans]|nr:CBS domain-containing protein [Thermoflavifilum aggregans]